MRFTFSLESTLSLFYARLKAYLLHKSFPPQTLVLPQVLTGPFLLSLSVFVFSFFFSYFLFLFFGSMQ